MAYDVGLFPGELSVETLAHAVWDELSKISANQAVVVAEQHVAPVKPVNGEIAFADGTHWNPGGGRGFYYWDETGVVWKLLG